MNANTLADKIANTTSYAPLEGKFVLRVSQKELDLIVQVLRAHRPAESPTTDTRNARYGGS